MLSLGKALAVRGSVSARGFLVFHLSIYSPKYVPVLNIQRWIKMVLGFKEPIETNDC